MNTSYFATSEAIEFCYSSFNGSCMRSIRLVSTQYIMYVALCSAILMTVIGNVTIIISISQFKQLHTPTNYLLLSLAVTDFLVGSFVMPYSMVRSIETCWYFGDLFYRYYAVCDPLRYPALISGSVTGIMIIICWAVSAGISFGMVFLELNIKGCEAFYYQHVKCIGGCTLFLSKEAALLSSMISFYIPGFVMVCIYLKIYSVARKQARSLKDITVRHHTQEDRRSQLSGKRERKAAKTLGIVMGVFLTCWFPFFCCNVMDPFLGYAMPSVLVDALVWFGYLNSTFNPMIYAFFYTWFQKALKMIASGKLFKHDSSNARLQYFHDE
ncbi:trace amine-associated receptor 1-like [Protopterus annectens]|uniref:trace amine-associated receptor 1-like n=1 Tax=Protopterus annectens TaxID=7888 RepID=UPI001CFB00D2|nr:trace amine-associated receptor 1-like [Protopterus annectens]